MTDAQLAANRANAQNSTGPKSADGKTVASRNATRHGLSGARVVIAGESEADYHRFAEACIRQYRPQGDVEGDLVREIAATRWRLRRVEALEAQLLDAEMATLDSNPDNAIPAENLLAAAFRNLAENKGALAQLHRHEGRLHRAYEKALRELRLLQAQSQEQAGSAQSEQNPAEETLQNEPKQAATPQPPSTPSPFLQTCLKYAAAFNAAPARPPASSAAA